MNVSPLSSLKPIALGLAALLPLSTTMAFDEPEQPKHNQFIQWEEQCQGVGSNAICEYVGMAKDISRQDNGNFMITFIHDRSSNEMQIGLSLDPRNVENDYTFSNSTFTLAFDSDEIIDFNHEPQTDEIMVIESTLGKAVAPTIGITAYDDLAGHVMLMLDVHDTAAFIAEDEHGNQRLFAFSVEEIAL